MRCCRSSAKPRPNTRSEEDRDARAIARESSGCVPVERQRAAEGGRADKGAAAELTAQAARAASASGRRATNARASPYSRCRRLNGEAAPALLASRHRRTGRPASQRPCGGTEIVAAFDAYLHGRDLYEAGIDERSDREALAWFDRAITLDPRYPAPTQRAPARWRSSAISMPTMPSGSGLYDRRRRRCAQVDLISPRFRRGLLRAGLRARRPRAISTISSKDRIFSASHGRRDTPNSSEICSSEGASPSEIGIGGDAPDEDAGDLRRQCSELDLHRQAADLSAAWTARARALARAGGDPAHRMIGSGEGTGDERAEGTSMPGTGLIALQPDHVACQSPSRPSPQSTVASRPTAGCSTSRDHGAKRRRAEMGAAFAARATTASPLVPPRSPSSF